MPKLERKLEKARTEQSMLAKECATWAIDAKKMRKLKANLVEMVKTIAQLQIIQQMELE